MTSTEYKAERERRGTQAQVAAMLGVSRITIARRETDALPIPREAEIAIRALPVAKPEGRKPKAKE